MRNFKKWTAIICSAMMAVSGLAGCGGTSAAQVTTSTSASSSVSGSSAGSAGTDGADASVGSASTGTTAATGETTSGNTIVYQINTLIDTMDPIIANDGTSFDVIAQVMEGLYTKDENGSPILGMASDVEESDDGMTYTFTIRDDAKWSATGDPVTANDFEFAWKRLADPATAAAYQWFVQTACIKNADAVVSGEMDPDELGVTAKDDKTLVVELSSPCPILAQLLTSACFMPIEESFFEKCGDSFATSPETINCNGPFVMTDYQVSATTFSAAKNPDYYDADKVTLNGIQWQVIQDSQTAAMSYDNGTLDAVTLTGSTIEQYQNDPDYTTRADGYVWFLVPNLSAEGLDNLNIRLALAKSFDKSAICTGILKDGSEPIDYLVPKSVATSPDGKDFREDAGESYDNFSYDLTAAQDYWQKGLDELGVDSLSLTLLCDDPDSCQQIAQYLQGQWQSNLPGLTIELKVEPKKARLEDMQNGDFDIGLNRWGPDYADPMTYMDMFETGSVTDYGGWSNSDYDDIIESAKFGDLALDENARWDKLVECEKMLADDCVIFPIYAQSQAQMISSSVSGIEFFTIGAHYFMKYATKL